MSPVRPAVTRRRGRSAGCRGGEAGRIPTAPRDRRSWWWQSWASDQRNASRLAGARCRLARSGCRRRPAGAENLSMDLQIELHDESPAVDAQRGIDLGVDAERHGYEPACMPDHLLPPRDYAE